MRNTIILFLGALLLAACGGGGGSKSLDPPPVAAKPEKAVLISPAQNELCTQGVINSASQSTVTLQWKAAANANTYDVAIENLQTTVLTLQSTINTKMDVTLDRNTPYAWYVVSKSFTNTATAQSDTWKFYNAGLSVVSYAPFPAAIVAPIMAQSVSAASGKVSLSWTGSDVDNDIASYDVYFDTAASPVLVKSGVTALKYDVSITPGNTYYWKIITRDLKGNTSDSGIYQFAATK